MSKPVSNTTQEPATSMPPSPQTTSSWRSAFTEVFAGGTGGAAGAFAIGPFMYFKMHMQEKARNPQNPPAFQKNPVKWFVGSPAMAAGMFPVTASQFFVNGYLRKKVSNNGERELNAAEKLGCSVATGVLTAMPVNVQELIWTQQQKAQVEVEKMMKEQNVPKEKMPKVGAFEIVKKICKEHGVRGFGRGFYETAGREAVSASVLTNLAADFPFLAPVVGATLSQPLDGRKTSKQVDFFYKGSMRELFKAKAFSGLAVGRIPIYLIFMNVAPVVKEQVAKAFNV